MIEQAPPAPQGAPAAQPAADPARFDKFFGTVDPEPAQPGAEPIAAAPPPPDKTAAPVPKEPPPPPLAEIIRAEREARAARQAAHAEAQTARDELTAARAELQALKGSQAFEDDPLAYARSRKWSAEKQALVGQTLLYDLVPDKAPPDFRIKMFESKHAEKTAREVTEREAARAEAIRAAEVRQLHDYVSGLGAAAQTFEAGSHPESEAWFGDDHEAYVKSLFATANNMADGARAQGRVADLSAGAVALALEQEVAGRMSRRDERARGRQQQKPVEGAPPAAGGVRPTGNTTSTKGLTGSGTPRPPAQTDSERLQRAIEAAFPSR